MRTVPIQLSLMLALFTPFLVFLPMRAERVYACDSEQREFIKASHRFKTLKEKWSEKVRGGQRGVEDADILKKITEAGVELLRFSQSDFRPLGYFYCFRLLGGIDLIESGVAIDDNGKLIGRAPHPNQAIILRHLELLSADESDHKRAGNALIMRWWLYQRYANYIARINDIDMPGILLTAQAYKYPIEENKSAEWHHKKAAELLEKAVLLKNRRACALARQLLQELSDKTSRDIIYSEKEGASSVAYKLYLALIMRVAQTVLDLNSLAIHQKKPGLSLKGLYPLLQQDKAIRNAIGQIFSVCCTVSRSNDRSEVSRMRETLYQWCCLPKKQEAPEVYQILTARLIQEELKQGARSKTKEKKADALFLLGSIAYQCSSDTQNIHLDLYKCDALEYREGAHKLLSESADMGHPHAEYYRDQISQLSQ